jgi:hypothetical protein
MTQLGAVILLLPLAWWFLHSVRLMHLCCGRSRTRNISLALATLLTFSAWLIVILATAHAIFFMVAMVLARW